MLLIFTLLLCLLIFLSFIFFFFFFLLVWEIEFFFFSFFFTFFPSFLSFLLLRRGVSGVVSLSGRVGRPQGEVVAQQLHDERAVLVGVLVQRVQLGDGVVERLHGAGRERERSE